jgi:hypothetical protein
MRIYLGVWQRQEERGITECSMSYVEGEDVVSVVNSCFAHQTS